MRITFTRICSISLVFILLFASMATASTPNYAAISQLDQKYGLKSVDKIPDGKVALMFDSVEEADKFLNALQNKTYYDYSSIKTSDGKCVGELLDANKKSYAIAGDTYGSQTYSEFVPSPCAWFNLRVNYTYYWNSSLNCLCFRRCNGVSSDISGMNMWFTWWQTYSTSQITNNGRGLYAYVEGNLEYYLIINGFWKIFTEHKTSWHTFSVN